MNLLSIDSRAESRAKWPWDEFNAVFSPASDILGRAWHVEEDVRCALPSGAGSDTIRNRDRNRTCGRRVVIRVEGQRPGGPDHRLRLLYGPDGRLLELSDSDCLNPYRLEYRYDAAGRLIQERLLQARSDRSTARTADRFHTATGELASVEVRDGDGRLTEAHSFLAEGRMTCRRGLGPDDRVWFEETTECLTDGRIGERRSVVFDPIEPAITRSERIETWDYDSDCPGPLRWRIVERHDDGRRAVIEEIRYDPGCGRPIEDDTRYYEVDEDGQLVERFRLLMRQSCDHLDAVEVIEEDIVRGLVRLRRLGSWADAHHGAAMVRA
jgi:hypothetical protein